MGDIKRRGCCKMKFEDFLVKAKKNTYAAGAKPRDIWNGFEELTYGEKGLRYRDRWTGSDPFGGEEIVHMSGKVIWMMNYYGFTTSDKVKKEEVYSFLREALNMVTKDKPFRGPVSFKKGELEYINKSAGNLAKFVGIEQILQNGKEVYRLSYHGGKIE